MLAPFWIRVATLRRNDFLSSRDSNFEARVRSFGPRVRGLGARLRSFRSRVRGFGARLLGFRSRVRGFFVQKPKAQPEMTKKWARVRGFGARVRGFGAGVRGFGAGVRSFGTRLRGFTSQGVQKC